jgi:hypothetical protein
MASSSTGGGGKNSSSAAGSAMEILQKSDVYSFAIILHEIYSRPAIENKGRDRPLRKRFI